MKHQPPSRTHTADDPPPTTIHHPEDDDTLLAQWLRRAMAKGATFWVLIGGAVAMAAGVAYLAGGLTAGETATARAWKDFMLASSPEDLQKLSETAAATPVGGWAGLMAATARYREALSRLPNDRDAAAPILSQALEGFRAVQEDAKADDLIRRLASVGIAHTHETRNELAEAISAYEKLASTWPETEDGKQAAARAKLLRQPEVVAFYKQFAEFKPKVASSSLGPRGTNRLDPLSGFTDPNAVMPAPSLTGGVSAGSVPSPEGELPREVFQNDAPAKGDDLGLPDVFADPAKQGASPRPR